MLFALSTHNKIGLASVGAAFILFALISSFVLPRINSNFPGRGLVVYLGVCVLFFVAMISAVLVFDKEAPSAEAASSTPAQTTGATTTTAPAVKGDATAGKAVFASAGCTACHTFTPAGSKGAIGPNLDKLAAEAAVAKQPLDAFVRQSIVDPNAYIAPGFAKGVMPPNFGTSLTPTQLDNLVAFVTQGK